MSEYEGDFPKSTSSFLKAEQFQDQEIPLTYKGWKKKANLDIPPKGSRGMISWKQRLKFTLRYSYPEFAKDEAGENILEKDGVTPKKNRNFDPNFPQGYSITYIFEEGQLESGSLPLFNAFCFVRPKTGDVVSLKRTGEGQETKWSLKRMPLGQIHATAGEMREIQMNEPDDENLPF